MNRPAKAQARGAISSNTSYKDIIRAWRLHHHHSATNSFSRLLRTPIQTIMTSLVVAIALALPATLLLTLNNIERLGATWDAQPKLSVFLHVRAQPAAVQSLQRKLQALPSIEATEYISPAQALVEFQTQSGFTDALGGLDENPLPPTLVVTPNASALQPESLQALAASIRLEPIVESVDLDMEWVRRLRAMMALGRDVVVALAGLLGLGVLLAIGNTIRLGIESRKEEIIVTKLVGGTNGFVRRPFLYSGVWYGVAGGVLACIIVGTGFSHLKGAVNTLANTYSASFELQGLGLQNSAALLAVSAVLGWLGAWLAVSRHLHRIQPQ